MKIFIRHSLVLTLFLLSAVRGALAAESPYGVNIHAPQGAELNRDPARITVM